ncbi:MAG: HAMP domain-containing protein [Chlorobi bacterium]|nr:HAMP domain-containing protein [Chlorobiota bacterium]
MKHRLRNQIGIIFFVIGGIFMVIMGYTYFTIEGNEADGTVINLAGRQRMLTQKMTKEAIAVSQGKVKKETLDATAKLFDKTLSGLISGNDELPPTENEEILAQLNIVKDLWQKFYAMVKKMENNPQDNEALNYLLANNITLLKEMNKAVGLFEQESRSKLDSIKFLSAMIGILTIFTIILVLIASKKKLIAPIENLVIATKEISAGNLDIELKCNFKNEFDELGAAFVELAGNIKEYRQNLIAEKESIEKKVEEAVEKSEQEKQYLAESVNRIVTIMEKVAEGDLTVSVDLRENDGENIKKLFNGFNFVIEGFKKILISVTEAVQATASASTQISSSAEEMAAGASEQSSQTGEIAAAMEEMTKTIVETNQNTNVAAQSVKETTDLAHEGGSAVKLTIDEMDEIANIVVKAAETVKNLGESSEKIGEIIHVINDIADQTNLLALNAAIEAARAGEQGRGFAVVADEVRKLAERTTKATKEIADMIVQLQNGTQETVESIEKGVEEVKHGKELAAKTGESMQKIVDSSTQVMDVVSQVATASEEQSATAEEISKNIEAINMVNMVAQESALGVQEIAKASEDLSQLTEHLQQIVEQFKIDNSYENAQRNYLESHDENNYLN